MDFQVRGIELIDTLDTDALDQPNELLAAALGPVADGMRSLPKAIAPRIIGQSLQEVENALTEAVNRLLKLGSHGIETFKAKTESREL